MIGGTGIALNALACAALGAVVGVAARRSWGPARAAGLALVTVWPVVAALTLAALSLFSRLRKLTLDQIVISWRGVAHFWRRLGLGDAARAGDDVVRWTG